MFFRRANILKRQIQYLRLQGPTLATISCYARIPSRLDIYQPNCGVLAQTPQPGFPPQPPATTLQLLNDCNGSIRALYLTLLTLCQADQSQTLLMRFKQLVYDCPIPAERHSVFLQRHGLGCLSRPNLLKKLMAEFLQLRETVVEVVRRLPALDLVLVIVVRGLLEYYGRVGGRVEVFGERVDMRVMVREFAGMMGVEWKEVNSGGEWMIEGVRVKEEGNYIILEFPDKNLKASIMPTFQTDLSCRTYATTAADLSTRTIPTSPTKTIFDRKLSIENSARIAVSEQSLSSSNQSDVIQRYLFMREVEVEENREGEGVSAVPMRPDCDPRRMEKWEPSGSQQEARNNCQDERRNRQSNSPENPEKKRLSRCKFTKLKMAESGFCTEEELNSLNSTMAEPARNNTNAMTTRQSNWIRNFWSTYPNKPRRIQSTTTNITQKPTPTPTPTTIQPTPTNIPTETSTQKRHISISKQRITAKNKPNLQLKLHLKLQHLHQDSTMTTETPSSSKQTPKKNQNFKITMTPKPSLPPRVKFTYTSPRNRERQEERSPRLRDLSPRFQRFQSPKKSGLGFQHRLVVLAHR